MPDLSNRFSEIKQMLLALPLKQKAYAVMKTAGTLARELLTILQVHAVSPIRQRLRQMDWKKPVRLREKRKMPSENTDKNDNPVVKPRKRRFRITMPIAIIVCAVLMFMAFVVLIIKPSTPVTVRHEFDVGPNIVGGVKTGVNTIKVGIEKIRGKDKTISDVSKERSK